MAVRDGISDIFYRPLDGAHDRGIVVQSVQRSHTAAVTVPQILPGEDAVAIVHVLGKDGAVGDRGALHAPLVAENAGHQAVMRAGPHNAEAVEGAHHAQTAALDDTALEALEVQLADGLLVGPGGDPVAALLLVVEREVLGEHIHAAILDGSDLHGGDLAGYPAVLGVILKVAAAVGRSVDIGAGPVNAGEHRAGAIGRVQEVLADALAHVFDQLEVIGGGHHVLGGVGHGRGAAGQRLGEALRPVFIVGAGQIDGGHRAGEVEAVVHEVRHLGIGDLGDQLRPAGIVIVRHRQINGVERAGNAHLRHGRVRPIEALHLLDDGLMAALLMGQAVGPHLVRDMERLGRGEGAEPIAAGEVGQGLTAVAAVLVQVGVLKAVGDGLAGHGRHRVGGLVEAGVGPLLGQGGVAAAGHTAGVRALGSQDVVDGVMGVFAHGEVVVAVLKDIGLGVDIVIGGQILLVDCDREVLGVAGGDHFLVKAADLHSRLLDEIVDIILGVGRLEIDLHGVFSVNAADVLDVELDLEGFALVLDAEIRVGKVGIAQAVAEGEGHVVVVPVIAGVAAVQDEVLIAGLVVAVTDIDALLIDHIVLVALVDAGVGVVLRGGDPVFGAVGPGIGAKVLHGGAGVVVLEEGVHDAAGGVHLARKDIGHAQDAGHAHVADPQDGVDPVIVDKIKLQGVGGVQQDHDFFEGPVLFERLQVFKHLDLFLAEAEIIAVGHICLKLRKARGQIRALAAGTGQNHKGHVAVGGEGVFERVGVFFPGDLIDAVLRLIAAGRRGVLALITRGSEELPHVQIDGAFAKVLLQRGFERDRVVRGDLAGAGPAVKEVEAGLREGGELRSRRERQGVVAVDEKSRALGLDIAAELLFKGYELLFAFVIGPEKDLRAFSGDDLLCFRAKGDVDRVVKGSCDRDRHDGNDHQHSKDRGQDLPNPAGFFHKELLCIIF